MSRVRADVGNLSTPWLVVALLAGAHATRIRTGALLGLAATMSALVGFYVLTTFVIDLGTHSWIGDLRRELEANRVYFQGGLLSGPLFGAVGAWWNRGRAFGKSMLVGALLIAEPVALAAIGVVFPHGVVRSASVPLLLRIVPGWTLSGDPGAAVVYGTEVALGAVLVATALWQHRQVSGPHNAA